MPNNLVIISAIPDGLGWTPVRHMVSLAADLYDAEIVKISPNGSKIKLVISAVLGRKRNKKKPNALIIVPYYADFQQICEIPNWRSSFNKISVWVFDSFWTNRLVNFPISRLIDYLYIAVGTDLAHYQKKAKVKTGYLPWGSDVLNFGGVSSTDREIDLLRLGRQPADWENDKETLELLQDIEINYHGRPPNLEHTGSSQKSLLELYMKKSKFVLAHTNFVDDSLYTHPTKEYITARWTDSLACGCIVAGCPPKTDCAYNELLWPGALLEFGSGNRANALPLLEQAIKSWTPLDALYNYRMSLEKLDWRWRFKSIADQLEMSFPKLDADLEKINSIISDLDNELKI